MQRLAPANWAAQLGIEKFGPLSTGMSSGVDVGVDGKVGFAKIGRLDSAAQSIACRSHKGGVEGAAYGHRHHLFGAEFFCDSGCSRYRFRIASDDDLSGSVVVGHPHVAVDAGAGNFDIAIIESEDRGHRADPSGSGIEHCSAAFCDKREAFFEGQCT